MTLISTPKAPDANTYVDEATATALLGEGRLYVSGWTSGTSGEREAALQWATTLLDACYIWNGTKRTEAQALRWPRSGVFDRDGFQYNYDTIPRVLERATAIFAFYLKTRDRLAEPALLGLGLSSVGGKVAVSIDPKQILPILPAEVTTLLSPLGVPKTGSTGSGGIYQARVGRA